LKARSGGATLPSVAPERFSTRWLATRLRELAGPLRGRHLCLAFSGGLDSSVLLAALAAVRTRSGFWLRAVHVDHGLHPQSRLWAAAAQAQARALRVPCEVVRLRIQPRRGESLEAVARQRRYAALTARLALGELLLTAHHQEDQLETVLLALLRGSGVRGLSAMTASSTMAHGLLLRPLLPVARAQLEQFARARKLQWTEDLTNLDERFDRNYLRRQVLPRLRERWPAAAATVSRSASHLAEAQGLLECLARAGMAQAADGAALRISVLRGMSLAQRCNVLRCWIAARGLSAPDHRRLREIAGPMLEARSDAVPCVQWRGGELRRHGDQLLALAERVGGEPAAIERWDWHGRPWLALGSGTALGLVADRHGDVDLAALPCPLRVDFRQGGERLRESHGRVALKDLLQSQGIAPWERAGVPLLRDRGRIVAVADLWLDAAYRADRRGATARGRFRWRRGAAVLERAIGHSPRARGD
jgi:tRNA(Ile)-lysidine synthase